MTERPPVDEEELGISRRQFFNRGILVTMAVSLGAFGAAAISFLYAKSAGGFGGKVDAGGSASPTSRRTTTGKKQPYYVPEARTYLLPYPKADVTKAKKIPQYQPVLAGMEQGIVALYQKCVHLGCKVPWCQHVAVVRVPLPRLEVQPRRREARWPGPARARPLRRQRQRPEGS